MDLPIILEGRKLVSGVEEKNQEIYTVLKQSYGTILHNTDKGSNLMIHQHSVQREIDSINFALSVISEIQVDSVRVESGEIVIEYLYKGTKQLFIIPEEDVIAG